MKLTLLLIALSVFAALAFARPKARHAKATEMEEYDLLEMEEKEDDVKHLDSIEEKMPTGHAEMMQKLHFNLTEILYSAAVYRHRATPIYIQAAEDYWRPFEVASVSTAWEMDAFGVGSLTVKGAILRGINLIMIKLRPQEDIRFFTAELKLQVETGGEESAVRTIQINNLSSLCPKMDHTKEHVCNSGETVEIGPFFLPTIDELELGKREVTTLHISMVNELAERLMDTRIFVAKNSPVRD